MADFTSDETPTEQFNITDASAEQLLNNQDGVEDDESQYFETGVQTVTENNIPENVLSKGTGDAGGQNNSSSDETGSGSGESGAESTGNFTSGAETNGNVSGAEEGGVQQEKEAQYTIDDIYNLVEDYQKRMLTYEERSLESIEKIKVITRSNVAVTSIILGIIIVYMFIGRLY